MTCQGLPGSLGFEEQDAKSFSEWGVDYLKYDNCNNMGVPAFERYHKMAIALRMTGSNIFYSICNWGNEQVTKWGKNIAHSWRTTQDIEIYHTSQNQWQQLKSNFLVN
jgi:alpha-galactosidase